MSKKIGGSLKIIFVCLGLPIILSLFYMNCNSKDFGNSVHFSERQDLAVNTYSSDDELIDEEPQEDNDDKTNVDYECVETIEKLTTPVKVLFVVDTSGSSVRDANSKTGTDPHKDFRYGKIKEFLENNKDKKNLHWQFITFSGSTANSYIADEMTKQIAFTNDVNLAFSALERFFSWKDQGWTPYRAAFSAIQNSIQKDKDFNDPSMNYATLFLSDGKPTDYCENSRFHQSGCPIDTNEIYSDVLKIVNMAHRRITLNTLYYGPEDLSARNLLNGMAEKGNGLFVDTNLSTRNIKLGDTIQVQVPCE